MEKEFVNKIIALREANVVLINILAAFSQKKEGKILENIISIKTEYAYLRYAKRSLLLGTPVVSSESIPGWLITKKRKNNTFYSYFDPFISEIEKDKIRKSLSLRRSVYEKLLLIANKMDPKDKNNTMNKLVDQYIEQYFIELWEVIDEKQDTKGQSNLGYLTLQYLYDEVDRSLAQDFSKNKKFREIIFEIITGTVTDNRKKMQEEAIEDVLEYDRKYNFREHLQTIPKSDDDLEELDKIKFFLEKESVQHEC